MIDQCSFGEELLSDCDGLNRLLNFAFKIVALIDHVSDIGFGIIFPFVKENLVKDSKDLIGVDRADR